MRQRVLSAFVLAALVSGPIGGEARGATPLPDRVEEDWELVVGTPDSVSAGPQITTAMKLDDDDNTPFVAFNLNYRDAPFAAGGVQSVVWSGDSVLGQATQGSAVFKTSGETVTWTQVMRLNNGQITYRIEDGESTTWDEFGQDDGLRSVSFPTTAVSLIGYSPARSAEASGAGWKANNVTSLSLLRVRYYAGSQLLSVDETPRTIIAQDQ